MTMQYDYGLLDTCVLIDMASLPSDSLPPVTAVSMISVAELHVGVEAAGRNPRPRRMDLPYRRHGDGEPHAALHPQPR